MAWIPSFLIPDEVYCNSARRVRQSGRFLRMSVVLIGTLDTKGVEFQFVRDLLNQSGVPTLVIDTGVLGPPHFAADISSEQVYAAAGTTLAAVQRSADR